MVTINGFVSQPGATWGLGRVSHRQPGATSYDHDSSAGAGTCAYVIDTGVEASHPVSLPTCASRSPREQPCEMGA